MADTVKILAVGSAFGSIRELFSKIKAINEKHGKFDLVLCTGDFFGQSEDRMDEVAQLLEGKLETPLECYIMQGSQPLPENVVIKFSQTSGELCRNVFLMSKSGIVTTANGLRIACLGGIYEPNIFSKAEAAPGFLSPFFSSQSVERLLSNALTKNSGSQNYRSLAAIQSISSPNQLVDILITNSWPSSVVRLSSNPLPDQSLVSSTAPPLNDVIRKLKPRYHFAIGGTPPKFWEREPYLWEDEDGRVSRFVGLGAFGGETVNGKKQRWFYAFSISPRTSSAPKPANVTGNPFLESVTRAPKRTIETSEGQNFIFGNVSQPQKRSRITQSDTGKPPPGYKCRRCESTEHFINECPDRIAPPEGYICKICNTPGHLVRDCPTRNAVGDTGGRKPKPGYVCRACGSENHYLEDCLTANVRVSEHGHRNGRHETRKEITSDECWFCLSNPKLAKHLIVAIGSECYVTLPKGQIISTQSAADYADVPGGGHVLIVPITHSLTYATIPPDLTPPILEETERFKSALRAMYAKYGSTMVCFEVGRLSAKGGHAHIQVVPLPMKLEDKVEQAFINGGKAQGIIFEEDSDAAMLACSSGSTSYFRVDLPDGRKMVHLLKDDIPFSIQFGRQVLVSLLELPERLDWKACMLSEEEDRLDAQAFKIAFAPFDPSS